GRAQRPSLSQRRVYGTQVPPEQFGVAAEQTLPQRPQLFGSTALCVSQPSAGLPLQFAKPVLQPMIAQLPELQIVDAFAALQTCPQLPQLFVSLLTFTSQPVL